MKQADSCQRGGGLKAWMKESDGIKQKKIYIYIILHYIILHINTDNSVVLTRGEGRGGKWKWAKWGIKGSGKRLCFG